MSNRVRHSKAGARRGEGRAWPRFLLLAWTILALTVSAPRWTYAQEDKGGAKAAPDAAAPAPDAAKEAAKPKQDQQSKISWIVESSGWIGLFILGLSIYFVATVSRLFLEMRPIIAMPPEIIARCEALLDQRDFKSIFGVVKEDNSFFSTALATGIGELPNGLAEAREAMEKVGESVTTEMEKKISMLAVLGTLGPMIGLLGTLMGMISSFGAIARGGDSLDPTLVAKGISQALVITFEGVFLSVPAIYFYALFRNRVSTISVTTMVRADQFLRHFAHAARGKGTGPGSTAQATAAKAARP
ncbi:MAG TPA: MotA/TolQ/ExbB proton channel family protein [Pirellulales bacterium]|nr:MotA/TolQ/ExbB proton channel family protein [Pirellulales bacterium]